MKRISFLAFTLLILLESIHAQERDNFLLFTDSVVTSYGLKLATDIYISNENEAFPSLLIRTPYNKVNAKNTALNFVKQGYVVIVQDCRGKFGSEGEFYAFKNEREDGLKTVEWIKQQPWFNGKIAGFGASYEGYTQWAISDCLDAVCAEMTGSDMYELIYPQGLFSLATAFNWGLTVDARTENSISTESMQKSYWHLPLSVTAASTYQKENIYLNDWLLHENRDSYWQLLNNRGIAKGALFSIAGWYDIFLLSQLNDFIAHEQKNNHPNNRMIITPWGHGVQSFSNEYGGYAKTGNTRELLEQFLAKKILEDEKVSLKAPFSDHKFNFFIMERNEYVGSDTWPHKDVKETLFFLGENEIMREVPKKAAQMKFVYNPLDPYPSLGGTFLGNKIGPAVQNQNITRNDQWVFESEVLSSPLTLLGSISAKLYVSSSVKSTDFIMMVQDVFPNDTIINIQEGGKRVDLKPNKVTEVNIDSWPTGYQLNPGHKLRVVITSSYFPRFNRNLNCDEPIYMSRKIKKAVQTIYTGPKKPSSITLPVLNIVHD